MGCVQREMFECRECACWRGAWTGQIVVHLAPQQVIGNPEATKAEIVLEYYGGLEYVTQKYLFKLTASYTFKQC